MRLKRETMTGNKSALAASAIALATATGLTACSGGSIEPDRPVAQSYGCIDDSKQCIDQRQAALRALQSDRTRAWVRQPASVGSYATGVRLFAFKTEKQRLSCDELAVGRREADLAPGVLRGPQAQGIQTGIVARGLMFAGDVSKELGKEAQRRCRV
jgi:hypothetical protein